MNNFLSVKKAWATLMMLLLIMSPLSSLGPRPAMAVEIGGIQIQNKTGETRGACQYDYVFFVKLASTGEIKKTTVYGTGADCQNNGKDVKHNGNFDGTTEKWNAGDEILLLEVLKNNFKIATVDVASWSSVSDPTGIVQSDGGSFIWGGDYPVVKSGNSNINLWYNGLNTNPDDARIIVKKKWQNTDGSVSTVMPEDTNATIDVTFPSNISLSYEGNKGELPQPITVYTTENVKDGNEYTFSEKIPDSNETRAFEFIKAVLTDKDGTEIDNLLSCSNGDQSCFVVEATNGLKKGNTYTLTYYNRYITPNPFEIRKQVEGEDIMDWCEDRVQCDVDTLLADGMLTFDIYSLVDGWESTCINGICTGDDDPRGVIVGDPILTGKLDGDGIITFEPRVFIADGWYGVVETINPAIENYFKKPNAHIIYVKDSIAYESITEGVNPAGVDAFTFQNEGNLYNTIALDIDVDVFDRTMQQTIEEFYVQDWREIQAQDWREIQLQDWREIQLQDWREIYTQEWRDIYAQDWRKIMAQGYLEIFAPMFEKYITSINDTLVTRLENKGGKFGNGMTYLEVNYADAKAGKTYTIADSSPSNKAIAYTYDIKIGDDGKLHLTIGDDRLLSASVTAKLYESAPKSHDPSGHKTIKAGEELIVDLPAAANKAPTATATMKGNDVTVSVAGLTTIVQYVKNGKANFSIGGYEGVVEFNGNGVKSATVTSYPSVNVPNTGSFFMFVHFDSLKYFTNPLNIYEFVKWFLFTTEDYGNPEQIGTENFGASYRVDQENVGAPYETGKENVNAPRTIGKEDFGAPRTIGKEDFGALKTIGKEDFGAPRTIGKEDFGAPRTIGKEDFGAPRTIGQENVNAPRKTGEDVGPLTEVSRTPFNGDVTAKIWGWDDDDELYLIDSDTLNPSAEYAGYYDGTALFELPAGDYLLELYAGSSMSPMAQKFVTCEISDNRCYETGGAPSGGKISFGTVISSTTNLPSNVISNYNDPGVGDEKAPRVEVGDEKAPKVEVGDEKAPRVEVGDKLAPRVEVGDQLTTRIALKEIARRTITGKELDPRIVVGDPKGAIYLGTNDPEDPNNLYGYEATNPFAKYDLFAKYNPERNRIRP